MLPFESGVIVIISIHTPREGSDALVQALREAFPISIHTPREGSDRKMRRDCQFNRYFNPHSPRGERRKAGKPFILRSLFQSTLPARGATVIMLNTGVRRGISIHTPREGSDYIHKTVDKSLKISIHTPREGSDQIWEFHIKLFRNFNPHSPRGERRSRCTGYR